MLTTVQVCPTRKHCSRVKTPGTLHQTTGMSIQTSDMCLTSLARLRTVMKGDRIKHRCQNTETQARNLLELCPLSVQPECIFAADTQSCFSIHSKQTIISAAGNA